ncbi:Nuclear elongation and deformation protein 1 [Phytophthora boehmeriae]|uniref:phosphatidate phosphatase n=1 Tax=Phytophthora boehmeriae TaxID=109152 RepID=A0A8T1WWE6_9STRA|nr:Nuclear elongation and deformation protein 1 [Phytophthora boehmeriae]
MNVIYSVKDYVSNVFHQDVDSGAIDVVAVQQDDGTLRCSPFHVHFGSLYKLKDQDKTQVTLEVNGHVVDGVRMKVGAAGEAYFVQQVQEPVDAKEYSASPLPSPINCSEDAAPFAVRRESADTVISDGEQPEDEEDAVQSSGVVQMEHDREGNMKHSESSDRLTWGWGALPSVRPGAVSEDDEELPRMVKSGSVYFDAVDSEAMTSWMSPDNEGDDAFDHPSMSLCGHLLTGEQSEDEVHRAFAENIVNFDFFRANAASILADSRLRFFVNGKLTTYNTEMQAFLVSRVLFPYSQRLPVLDLSPGSSETAKSVSTIQTGTIRESEGDVFTDKYPTTQFEGVSKISAGRSIFNRASSALAPLDEVASDDGGSTQDTASFNGDVYFKKSLQPSQEELLMMGLRVGTNDVEFVLRCQETGELERVSAKLYMWPDTAKVVIAQIDGAISSRAATGSMFKRRDPAAMHPGAPEFYSMLARNGYRIVYVTCHGLSQSNLLHALLHNGSEEDSVVSLPMGPVLHSPDRLLATNNNEMIDAQDFKVAALETLRALFPREVNPFYAAFGTTQSDSIVFTQVGVFQGKVFLVDTIDGSLRHRSLMGFHESYGSLLSRMDSIFPPIYSTMTQRRGSNDINSPLITSRKSPHTKVRATPTNSFAGDKEQLISEVVASHVRTRSLADEAYNDINFWRIEPGLVD